MVATVLRLRYRLLGNTLARSVWQLVGFLFGLLWALWILVFVTIGLVMLSITQGLDVARAVAILGGSLVLLGWLIGPLLVTGIDTTIDAARLAPFPLGTTQIMRVLTATGLTGVPGIATAVATLATVVLWVRWPVAAVIAVPCIVVAVLTCVVASRLMATLSGGLGQGRRGREIIGTLVLAALILSGPIFTGIASLLGAAADLPERLAQIATVAGWTPLGAPWAVPGDIAAGDGLSAVVKAAIAVGTLILLWILWRGAIDASITAPPRRVASSVRAGSLRWFGRMPTGPLGGTWARALTSWLHDPRYARQLIIVPLLPVLFALTSGIHGPIFILSPLLVGLVLAIVGYSDISFDGTAFAAVLSTGVRGRTDRLGRMAGAATVGVPLLLVTLVVVVALTGRWSDLPALAGGSIGLVLAGYGVSAVSSAMIVMPVAAPGDSPFKSVPGQTFLTSMSVFVVWAISIAISAPALALALIGVLTGQTLFGWLAVVAGIILGTAAVIIGVVVGGRLFDRNGPDLLTRMKAFPR